jgi:hypothetical protein
VRGGEDVNARMPIAWYLEERLVGLEAASGAAAEGALGLELGERARASNSLTAVA